MHEDQGPMPLGDYLRLETDRDKWKRQYQALESVVQRTLQALLASGRYLWHKPDASESQPCYDWCPKCQLEKARLELLDCLARTHELASEAQMGESGNVQGVADMPGHD